LENSLPNNNNLSEVADNVDKLTKKDIDEYIAGNQKNFDKIRSSLL
jgi:hypothetical protein